MTMLSDLRAYCNSLTGAQEDFPFDRTTLAMKVGGRIFALMGVDQDPDTPSINLKCDPELAELLRTTYSAVRPGFHMNKKHWNTVTADGSIPEPELYEMIDHSYQLIVKGLPRKVREALGLPS